MTLSQAVGTALTWSARKNMPVYVMRDWRRGTGFVALLWCDSCPSAVVGVVLPDGSYHGV